MLPACAPRARHSSVCTHAKCEREADEHCMGRAWMVQNAATSRAAGAWHTTPIPKGPPSMVHAMLDAHPDENAPQEAPPPGDSASSAAPGVQERGTGAEPGGKDDHNKSGSKDGLQWEGELRVRVVAAEHLPKKDMLGKCDGMVVVHFMGIQYRTEVRRRDYNPRWEADFAFRFQDANRPTKFARRDERSAALVFKVWDWDFLTRNDLVGVGEMSKDQVLQLLRQPSGYQEARTFALVDSKHQPVKGHDGHDCVLHVHLSLVHHRSLQPVRRQPPLPRSVLAAAADAAAQGDGPKDACTQAPSAQRAGGAQESAGGLGQGGGEGAGEEPAVHLLERPQVKVDVVRTRGWRGDNPPKAEFLLLEEQVVEEGEQEAKYQVLGRHSSELPADSRNMLMESPNFLFDARASQPDAEEEEEACGGEIFLTLISASHLPEAKAPGCGDPYCVLRCQGKEYTSGMRKNDRFPSWDETWCIKLAPECGEQEYDSDADDLQVQIDVMDYAYGKRLLVGRCFLSQRQLLGGKKQVLQIKKPMTASLQVEDTAGNMLVNSSGVTSQLHLSWRIARYIVDTGTSQYPALLPARALKLETCVYTLGMVEGKCRTVVVARAREKIAVHDVLVQAAEESKGQACVQECNTALVWVHVPNREHSILSLLLRITFSATVPLNAGQILERERGRWEEEARRALDFDLRNAEAKYEKKVHTIKALAEIEAEDVCHTMFIAGSKPHSVGLVLSDPHAEQASAEAREAATPSPHRPAGLIIERLLNPSPALESKLICNGDILVAVDGKPVEGETVLATEERLRGPHGSCVVLGLVGKVSHLPFEVTLVREGGVRLTAVMRMVTQRGHEEAEEVKSKYQTAIKLTRQRIRLRTQLPGALDEEALLAKCEEDVKQVYNRAGQAIVKLQVIHTEKVNVLQERQREQVAQAHANMVNAQAQMKQRFNAAFAQLNQFEARVAEEALEEAEALVKAKTDMTAKEREEFGRQRKQGEHVYLQKLTAERQACEADVQRLQAALARDVLEIEAAVEKDGDDERATRPAADSKANSKAGPATLQGEDEAGSCKDGLWWGLPQLPPPEEEEKEWEGKQPGQMRRHVAELDSALQQAGLAGEVAGRMQLSTGQGRQYQVALSARAPADTTQPVPVGALAALSLAFQGVVREVACGYEHALAVIASPQAAVGGTVWAWGRNDRGQLGLGHRQPRRMPQQVPLRLSLPPQARIKASGAVSCGRGYSMMIVEVPCAQGKWQTMVLGCGRNERDQLGLNHASEIRSWLWALGSRGGWQGLHAASASVLQDMCDANRIRSWHRLEALSQRRLQRLLQAQGMSENTETVNDFMAARDALPRVYSTNLRRAASSMHWLYSAHDHLEMVVVPQGLTVGRDGKIFHTNGVDEAGQQCACQQHAGFATSALTCTAHGQPVAWTPQLAHLTAYPPAERWVGPQAKASDGEAVRVAQEGDLVRVGVYPQDAGLATGEPPRTAPGLKNIQDGAQLGSNFVQRQIDGLMCTFDDPLASCSLSFHYDGAIHFPVPRPPCVCSHLAQTCMPRCVVCACRACLSRACLSARAHSHGRARSTSSLDAKASTRSCVGTNTLWLLSGAYVHCG
eukprot:Tamp_00977.p1 GENE.Tamp_00977~~Tamp_00977.p1  ORF type:complete len:1600 (-),score=387.37 Tamp_00977:221-5020(-)